MQTLEIISNTQSLNTLDTCSLESIPKVEHQKVLTQCNNDNITDTKVQANHVIQIEKENHNGLIKENEKPNITNAIKHKHLIRNFFDNKKNLLNRSNSQNS